MTSFVEKSWGFTTLFFSDLAELGRFEPSSVDNLPPPHRALLAHNDHMTVALESFHKSPVSVEALAEWRDEASYARCSLLSRQSDGAVVQFGMMRIWLADLPMAAQQEIAAKKTPLGRVLIEHNLRAVMALPEAGFQSLKTEIQAFRKKLMRMADGMTGPNRIYHINFQFFPTSNNLAGKEGRP